MKIGYIGLGIMGRPAALNLLRGGFSVGVWARRREATQPLQQAGATVYDSIAELAAASEVVITNVSDTPDVEAVVLGEGGIGDHLAAGGTVIDMSTIAPAAAAQLAAALAKKGIDFLDAPVSGGEKGAIDGALTFMVGGDEQAFERMQPVFAAMGKTITHIGKSGAGQVAKACNQIIIGATISGVAEAFRLAAGNGVELARVRQALSGGFANSKVLEVHALRMISGDYAPGFKAVLHQKDIGIALAAAADCGIALPSAELFMRRLQLLRESGDGELDSAAVSKVLPREE